MSQRSFEYVILIILKLFLLLIPLNETSKDVLVRNRRQLLFPNSTSTVLQFNVGIGTPSPAQHVNVDFTFQANFQLPGNRSQIPIDILGANSGYIGDSRKTREANTALDASKIDGKFESDAKLYYFYKNIEDMLESFGHNGTSCVLQTLCQLGAYPLHPHDEDDFLYEVASFVLNPTNDITHGVTEKDDGYSYIKAYKDGENGQDCTKTYSGCNTSLIDMFSVLI